MTPGVRIGDYTVVRAIGSGSQGATYLASDPSGESVAIKVLSLSTMANWKSLELFEREIETLRGLNHPSIPQFIDAIRDDDAVYLVQQFIEGDSLAEVLLTGSVGGEALHRVAADVMDVLAYLHEQIPPIVHRDVKPANIIRRPDGSHALVDFGGVQTIVVSDTGGSTVVGTSGYMPSEQLIGRAVPSSDMYGLGATLVHLATGIHPAELPTKRLRIEWNREAAPDLAPTIDAMLEPMPEDRPASARSVLRAARAGTSLVAAKPTVPARVLPSVEARIVRNPDRIEIRISDENWGVEGSGKAILGVCLFAMLPIALGGKAVLVLLGIFTFALFVMVTESAKPDRRVMISGDGEAHFTHRDGAGVLVREARGRLATNAEGYLLLETKDRGTVRLATLMTPAEVASAIHEAHEFGRGKLPTTGERMLENYRREKSEL